MALGAACYGFVFGLWRAPLQGVFAALKFPLLLSALVFTTAAANGAFAKLVGSTLSTGQVLCASLLGMAMLGIVLAAVAPISLLFVMSVESSGEALVGAPLAETREALGRAQRLLAGHVLVIGVAGVVCLRRLRGLLASLVGSAAVGARLFWLCLGVEALAGTQLSWILRPYLGKPGLPVEFLRTGALKGSFFEEVARWFAG